MRPFEMKKVDAPKVLQAIAYLKVAAPGEDDSPSVEFSQDDAPVLTEMGNNLLIAFIVDSGDSFTYIQHRHLSQAGITESELQQIGIGNLAEVAWNGNLRVTPHPTNEVFAVMLDGHFEASLILIDALWDESFRQFLHGEYVAAIPTRDVLAFCDSHSELGRQELQSIVDQLRTSNDHPLMHELLVRRNGKWIPDGTAP